MKLYAVMENNFQYNDENYYIGEGDVGKVTKLYRNEEKANEICLQKIQEFFNGRAYTFSSFGYGINDIFELGWENIFISDENEANTADVLEYTPPDEDSIMNMDYAGTYEFVRKYPKIIGFLKNPPFYVQELEVE